jgi:hypothetical protein
MRLGRLAYRAPPIQFDHVKVPSKKAPIRTLSWLFLTWISALPAIACDPANPDAVIPPARYSPVLSGSQSFRPVQPLPWGEVNRCVMPPEALKSAPEQGKADPKPKQEPGPHGQH